MICLLAALTSMLKTSSIIDSSASMTQIIIVFDEADASGVSGGKLVEKLLKSLKNPKDLKKLHRQLVQRNFYPLVTHAKSFNSL